MSDVRQLFTLAYAQHIPIVLVVTARPIFPMFLHGSYSFCFCVCFGCWHDVVSVPGVAAALRLSVFDGVGEELVAGCSDVSYVQVELPRCSYSGFSKPLGLMPCVFVCSSYGR